MEFEENENFLEGEFFGTLWYEYLKPFPILMEREGFLLCCDLEKQISDCKSPHPRWKKERILEKWNVFSSGVDRFSDGTFFFWRPPKKRTFPEQGVNEPPYGFSALKISPDGKNLKVVRDALGIFPLYFFHSPTRLVIWTDMTSMLLVLDELGISHSINPQAVYESFVFKSTPPDIPLEFPLMPIWFWMENNFSLENGQIVKHEPKAAFQIEFGGIATKSMDAAEEYKKTFVRILSEVLRKPKEKVGILFTGGLDSTIILNVMKEQWPVCAITVVQKEVPKEDDEAAKDFCLKNCIEHSIIELDRHSLSQFPDTVRDIEDFDSALPGLSLSLRAAAREARRLGIRTLISGSYIEPILGSNPSTLLTLKFFQYSAKFPGKHFFEGFSEDLRKRNIDYLPIAKKEVPFSLSMLKTVSKIQEKIFFEETDGSFSFSKEQVFCEEFLQTVDIERSIIPNYGHSPTEKASLFDLLTYSDLVFRGNIRNNLLNQRIAQSEGVEILPIFAHKALRDIIFSLPVEEKFNPRKYETTNLDNKFFIYQSLGSIIPDFLKKRKKTDPSVPAFSVWIQADCNREYICDIFQSLSNRKVFSGKFLQAMFGLYQKMSGDDKDVPLLFGKGRGMAIYQRTIWKMIALEEWFRFFSNRGYQVQERTEILEKSPETAL